MPPEVLVKYTNLQLKVISLLYTEFLLKVMTMMGSFGGGMFSVFYSFFRNDGKLDILDLINGVLGSLVSVTAGCYLYNGWDAIAVGFIGSILACFTMPLFDRMGVDDPVGASSG